MRRCGRSRPPTITNLNGQVSIDGATQPGGRSTGPKILIDTGDFPFEIESENNEALNVGFLNGGLLALKKAAIWSRIFGWAERGWAVDPVAHPVPA